MTCIHCPRLWRLYKRWHSLACPSYFRDVQVSPEFHPRGLTPKTFVADFLIRAVCYPSSRVIRRLVIHAVTMFFLYFIKLHSDQPLQDHVFSSIFKTMLSDDNCIYRKDAA